MTPEQRGAIDRFVTAVKGRYGERLVDVVLFGSRARGDARDDSDFDVAVILRDGDWSFWNEMQLLGGMAYDALIDDDIIVQPWVVALSAWHDPTKTIDQRLIANIRRDATQLDMIR